MSNKLVFAEVVYNIHELITYNIGKALTVTFHAINQSSQYNLVGNVLQTLNYPLLRKNHS